MAKAISPYAKSLEKGTATIVKGEKYGCEDEEEKEDPLAEVRGGIKKVFEEKGVVEKEEI